MYPHRIRLRGPWRLEPIAGDRPLPAAVTAYLPWKWREEGLGDFRGTVRHMRSFGLPSRLDDWERVWLTCAGASGPVTVWLNDERLGAIENAEQPFAFEVTGKLRERNVVCFDVTTTGPGGGLGDVALEIRASAWLENVAVETLAQGAGMQLRVTGRACGSAPQPLDAFVLAGRRVVYQTTLRPAETGVDFAWDIHLPPSEGPMPDSIAVELVHGSGIWYREEHRPSASDAGPGHTYASSENGGETTSSRDDDVS